MKEQEHPQNDPDLPFEEWFVRSLAGQLRLVLRVAVAACVFSILAHMAIFPSRIWPLSFGYIGVFILIPVLIAMFLTRYQFSAKTVSRISTAMSLSALFGVSGLVIHSNVIHFDMPYEGVLVITICVGMFGNLTWQRVLLITLMSSAFFIVGKFALSMDPITLTLIQSFFVLSFSVLAAMLAYLVERLFRAEFSHQNSLRQLSETDPLTGLLNRRGFEHRYELAQRSSLRSGKPLGFILADVDFFKHYNDHYGHDAGDRVLKDIAEALSGFARRPLDACARLGGEEFCLLLHEPDPQLLKQLGEKICAAVESLDTPHERSTVSHVVTVSLGITDVPPGSSFQQAYRRADHALYSAKESGRNRFVWTPAAAQSPATA